MRRLALLLALAACKTGSAPAATGDESHYHQGGAAAENTAYKPTYDKADLQRALTGERAAVTAAEQRLHDVEDKGDYHQLRIATADLAVRRRFVAALEACEATGQACPPRLDEPAWSFDIEANADPTLDVPLRFDLASWQKVTAELHGRACACRTISCVDSMFAAIDRLDMRPMPEVQSDDVARTSVVRARECLYRLRGLRRTPRAVAGD